MKMAQDIAPTDLIPSGPTVVLGRPETAVALGRLHQYDDSADGIGIA